MTIIITKAVRETADDGHSLLPENFQFHAPLIRMVVARQTSGSFLWW